MKRAGGTIGSAIAKLWLQELPHGRERERERVEFKLNQVQLNGISKSEWIGLE